MGGKSSKQTRHKRQAISERNRKVQDSKHSDIDESCDALEPVGLHQSAESQNLETRPSGTPLLEYLSSTKHLDSEFQNFLKTKNFDKTTEQYLAEIFLENLETCRRGYVKGDKFDEDSDESADSSNGCSEFQPNFAEFPSPESLQSENKRYSQWKAKTPDAIPLHEGFPDPHNSLKVDILKNQDFTAVDRHALESPESLLDLPVDAVVNHLIEVCQSELDKVRVLFTWCCAQNIHKLTETKVDGSIKDTLLKIKTKTKSYTMLFEDMCKCAGLECRTIHGMVKQTVGQNVTPCKHRWSAVRVDDTWRLLDVVFAANKKTAGTSHELHSVSSGKKEGSEAMASTTGLSDNIQDEFYFLTDPHEFIYNHLPNQQGWQLLARPVTKPEFESMAYLRKSFFGLGMHLLQAKRGIVHAANGETIIELGLPKGPTRQFMFRLSKLLEGSEKTNLTKCVYMEQSDGKLMIKITCPSTGTYTFKLYIKDTAVTETQYLEGAEYLIVCTQTSTEPTLLPHLNEKEWGPGQKLDDLEISSVNCKHGTIETDNGEVKLIFDFNPDKPVKITGKLKGAGLSDNMADQWILQSYTRDKIIIDLRLQERGSYALLLFAKYQASGGSFSEVCSFLVKASNGVSRKIKFPKLANQHAGYITAKSDLLAVSHKEAYFTSDSGQESIVFEKTSPLDYSVNLYFQDESGSTVLNNYVSTHETENGVTFNVRFPRSGMFEISIYAKKKGDQGRYVCVYEYVAYVPVRMMNCCPFPKKYGSWTNGCTVEGLNDGEVCEDKNISVRAVIPKARQVVVRKSASDHVTYLTQNAAGQWVGSVNTGEADKNLRLCAQFEDTPDSSVFTLTDHKVLSQDELTAWKTEEEREVKKETEQKVREEKEQETRLTDFQQAKADLDDALASQDIMKLLQVVHDIELKCYTVRLMKEYESAKTLLMSIERRLRLTQRLDNTELSEYTEPEGASQQTHTLQQIMKAGALVLEKDLASISSNPYGLQEKITQLSVKGLRPAVATQALKLIQSLQLEEVMKECNQAICLYRWILGMIEEAKPLKSINSIIKNTGGHLDISGVKKLDKNRIMIGQVKNSEQKSDQQNVLNERKQMDDIQEYPRTMIGQINM